MNSESIAVQTASTDADLNGVAIDCRINELYYGDFLAVRDSHVAIKTKGITGFIGPSGCGKSTVLRCINRMNDLIRSFRFEGELLFYGQDIYARGVDPVAVRRYIGMVFQQPNPFSMSVYDNVAFGLRLNRYKGDLLEKVENALSRAGLWNEVKDKLRTNGLSLSGGQQQRLCIARAIATEPSVLLMDEPCSALDPIATRTIEELMLALKEKYTIAIVTHNMQQAMRVADEAAFFSVDISKRGRTGYLVEFGPTQQIFEDTQEELTKKYISGQFS